MIWRAGTCCARASMLSVRPGPTSSSTCALPPPPVPEDRSVSSAPAKRTVERRCLTQYSGSVASAAVIHRPLTFDRNGICGGRRAMVRQNNLNSSSTGSSIAECAATSIRTRVQSMSRAASSRSRVSTSAAGPDATQSSGAFTAAMLRPSGINARNSLSASGTLNMRPRGIASNSRPRSITSSSPSASVITPDRHAATYSPML